MEFLDALKQYYKKISSQNFDTPFEARIQAAKNSKELFSIKKFDLRGTENLPSDPGFIFIYNHISNNDNYTLENDFQITLDSHFISSMISYTYYQNPGLRVIRYELPYEKAHRNYYNNFDYIKVYSKQFLTENISRVQLNESKKNFYDKAKLALSRGENLIFNPEGKSSTTEKSPSDFKAGVFKMIIRSGLDPFIVPLIMVNFDKLNSDTTYRCEIKKPFRLSSKIENFDDRNQIDEFLFSLNHDYKKWVNDLRKVNSGFEDDINALVQKRKKLIEEKNLIVFYGSSSFRLWSNLKEDFYPYNVLNFGFGGAFIEDCIRYFDELFYKLNPTALILYVGGNDLSLGYSPHKINSFFRKLLKLIKLKFPNSFVFCVSVKPSYHRIDQIENIKLLNSLIKKELMKTENTLFIDVFKLFLDDKNQIINSYFLIDNLHLSYNGYRVWQKEIYRALNQKLEILKT